MEKNCFKDAFKKSIVNLLDRIDIFEPDMYCTSNELQWLQSNLQENESKFLNIVGIDDEYNNILGQIPVFVLNYITNNEELMQSLGLMPGLKDKTFICDVCQIKRS